MSRIKGLQQHCGRTTNDGVTTSSTLSDLTGRGRPRDPSLDCVIRDAVLELILEGGFANVTVEGVAARTGVGKNTVYRRWPTKGRLVLDALRLNLPTFPKYKPNQDVRSNLLRQVGGFANVLTTEPAIASVVSSIAGERLHDPELEAMIAAYGEEARRPLIDTLDAAIRQGELPPSTDPALWTDLLLGPMLHQLLMRTGRVDQVSVERTIDIVLAGLRAIEGGDSGLGGPS
jgi:AcrR family transcriptional regulator